MSWKAGDRAYCIKKGEWIDGGGLTRLGLLPVFGTVYLVDGIKHEEYEPRPFLYLAGFDGIASNGLRINYDSTQFRKVVPQCDRAKEEREEWIQEQKDKVKTVVIGTEYERETL